MANKKKRIRLEETSAGNFPSLATRMTPKGILDFINDGVSEKQRTDLKEMGFDGFLGLKTDFIPGDLSYWLVSTFDPFSSSLMDGSLPITDEDIHRATGLPMGPLPVVEATKPDSNEDFQNLVTIWASQFGTRSVPKKNVLDKMKGQKKGGEEFKRNFIVYIVSVLLKGVKGATVSCRILKSLQDVSLISKYNWCYYTRQNFINSVLEWKKESVKGHAPMYKGPVLIMVFIYLDRVSFKGKRRFGTVYPTLSVWTKDEIKKRIKEEKNEAKSFGLGAVVTSLTASSIPDGITEEMNCKDASKDASEDQKFEVPTCIEVLAEAAKEFAQAYAKFSKAVRQAKFVAPYAKVVCQMSAIADQMVEGFNKSQHTKEKIDVEVEEKEEKDEKDTNGSDEVNDAMETDDLDDLEQQVKLDKGKTKVENHGFADVSAVIAESDRWFSDPEVQRLLDEAMNQLDLAFRPECSKVRKHRPIKDPGQPSFSLFDSQDSLYVTPGYENEPPLVHNNTSQSVPLATTANVSSPVTRRSPRLSPSCIPHTEIPRDLEKTKGVSASDKSVFLETDSPMVHDNSSPKVPLPTKALVSSPIRRSIRLSPPDIPHLEIQPDLKKRNKDVSAIFKSPFIERNINLFAVLKQGEKEVADFCFTDEIEESEILFKSKEHELSRSQLKSLISDDSVSVNVLYVWGHLLNTNERLRSPEAAYRLFLFLTNEVISEDVEYDKLSLVFFPITDPWKILICVNFISSKIEIIHTMKPKSVSFDPVISKVKNYMKKHLAEKIPKVSLLWRFTIEEFVPKALITGRDDNGICLMRHMDLYKGRSKQVLGLKVQVETILKRAKVMYCHAILTSDENLLKDKILKNSKCYKMGTSYQMNQDVQIMSDEDLWNYVFSNADENEVLVDTDWMQITRKGLCSLEPGKWLMDMVVDMMGIYSTFSKEDVLFIPTTLRHLKPTYKTVGSQYIKISYMPQDGSNIRYVFMPVLTEDHWLLCVGDMALKTIFVLDSKPPRRISHPHKRKLKGLVDNVAVVLSCKEGYEVFSDMKNFAFDFVKDYPYQQDGYNCGAYVIKSFEAGSGIDLWEQPNFYKDLDEYRVEVLIKLLRWDRNKRKVFV